MPGIGDRARIVVSLNDAGPLLNPKARQAALKPWPKSACLAREPEVPYLCTPPI